MKYLIILALTLCAFASAQGQPDTLWTRLYGDGLRNEGIIKVLLAPDGGYAMVGNRFRMEADTIIYRYQAVLRKTDGIGNELWFHTYQVLNTTVFFDGITTRDSGYVFVGVTDMDAYNALAIKTNAEGDTLWTRTFSNNGIENASIVAEDVNGGYLISGDRHGPVEPSNPYLQKRTVQGDTVWTKFYARSLWLTTIHINCIIENADSGFVLVGYTEDLDVDLRRFFAIRTDEHGDTLWMRDYLFPWLNSSEASFVQGFSDEGFLLSGKCGLPGSTDGLLLVRINETGDTLWTHVVRDVEGARIQGLPQGGYILAAWVLRWPYQQICLMHLDEHGNVLWQTVVGNTQGDWTPTEPLQTDDGGFLVGANAIIYGDPFLNRPGLLRFASEDGVDEPTGSGRLPNAYALLQNYPNPFNPTTRISYDLPRTSVVKLAVIDLLGREVRQLANEMQNAGNHTVLFDGGGLASGVYFYHLTAGDFAETKKMVLLK